MKHWIYKLFTLTILCIFYAAGIHAQSIVVPVTDDRELVLMGYSASAQSVFKTSPPNQPKANFGDGTNYTTYEARSFNGREGDFNYRTVDGTQMYCTSVTEEAFAETQLQLPHGARLDSLDWWGSDTSSENMTVFLLERCQADAAASSVVSTALVSSSSSPFNGNFFDNSIVGGHTIDNHSCAYIVRIRFDNDDTGCREGAALQLSKIRVQWARQISPAPASPTFSDVPNGSQFYPSVEALVASGITGGCGGGNFCPDNFVTRGQMAAFLSRALGVSFTTIADPANP